MAKRGRGDMLTGGTKDVNPQYATVSVTESAANTFTQATLALPVLRGGNMGRGSRYQVIELLWAWLDLQTNAGATGDGRDVILATTSQTALQTLQNPDVLFKYNDLITITTSGLYVEQNPHVFDFRDGAGHGIIVATENLYLGVIGTSQTATQTARCRIFYRFKNISIDEFVGLAIQQGG